jgi:hypothetical protein
MFFYHKSPRAGNEERSNGWIHAHSIPLGMRRSVEERLPAPNGIPLGMPPITTRIHSYGMSGSGCVLFGFYRAMQSYRTAKLFNRQPAPQFVKFDKIVKIEAITPPKIRPLARICNPCAFFTIFLSQIRASGSLQSPNSLNSKPTTIMYCLDS